jgi:hypothetical protein
MKSYPSTKYRTYCEKTTKKNALCFSMGENLEVYYSYETPVAYCHNGQLVVRKNDWKQTTGKHLNAIDGGDKSSRIDGKQFVSQLNKIMGGVL